MFRSRAFLLLAAYLFLLVPAARAVDEESPNETKAKTSLSTLGRKPDWDDLDVFQGTITREEFLHLLNDVYCTHAINPGLIDVRADEVHVLKSKDAPDQFVLRFAKSAAEELPLDRNWTPVAALPALPNESRPLTGFHIALDPGHLGGKWAQMEERWFQIGKKPPIEEGEMTLKVAQLLAPRLESLGAKVSLVRTNSEPATPYRPSDFRDIVLDLLHRAGVAEPREDYSGPADPEKEKSIRWQEELLFYRNSEIRRRASKVNYELQPDLVLCLHFNAEPWGNPAKPQLVPKNHLHLLINGSYLKEEIDLDDERHEMLRKLLSRSFPEELGLADTVAGKIAKVTGLPPYHYKTDNVTPVGKSGYVYLRNLMATRLYHCPTLYVEPYVMNSKEVFARVEAGDYKGKRKVAGKLRPSIYREYVDGVSKGLLEYFKKNRGAK